VRTTVILCDLDDMPDRRPGVAVVTININGTEHPLDVCQEHLKLLQALPPADSGARGPRAANTRGKTAPSRRAQTRQSAKPAKAAKAGPSKAPRPKANTAAAARAGGSRQPGSRRDRQARIAQAREWARAQGRDIADRGRLPQGLLQEYEKAHR
jgi:uncharacterized Zn-binding protein involved in type VI secretion